jgi:thiamine-phosphate pyrophosphorylase
MPARGKIYALMLWHKGFLLQKEAYLPIRLGKVYLSMVKIKDYSLYLVITEDCALGRDILGIAKAAIAGGVDILQMREKNKPREELSRVGSELAKLCKNSKTIFIVNDDPRLVKEIDADGVHIGQSDLNKSSIKEIREIVGENRLIGLSTHSLERFKEANESDADYISFGPIFFTKTKDYFIGTSDVENVLRIALKPVVFIGGINISNLDSLLNKGARNIALIRDILQAEDVMLKTKEFKVKLMEAGRR